MIPCAPQVIPDDEVQEAVEAKVEIPTQFGIAKFDFNGQTLKELSFKKVWTLSCCIWMCCVCGGGGGGGREVLNMEDMFIS